MNLAPNENFTHISNFANLCILNYTIEAYFIFDKIQLKLIILECVFVNLINLSRTKSQLTRQILNFA